MEITCPSCSSRFNLPDGVAKPGAKLRCSVCKSVFPLNPPDSAAAGDLGDAFSSPKGRKQALKEKFSWKKMMIALLVIMVLVGGAGGAYWFMRKDAATKGMPGGVSLAQKVEKLTMRNVRQYYVNNEKVGQLFVIEGRVVNGFPSVKELVQVEGSLYGVDKKALVSKVVHAGTSLSLFQLQVLGEKELESFLNNKIEILTNNTNIQPGGEVPFMIVFYNPPQGVAEFGVKIVDVRDPKP